MKTTDVASLSETELELTRTLIDAALSTSASIDKVATWLLAGHGATIALIVANLDKTSSFVGIEHLREVLVLLLFAGMFGFAEKYLAILVHIHLHINRQVRNDCDVVLENHKKRKDENGSIDIGFEPMKSLLVIQEIVPWYLRRTVRKSVGNSLKDPLYGHKRSVHYFNRQVLYAVLQLVFSVIAIFLIAVNI